MKKFNYYALYRLNNSLVVKFTRIAILVGLCILAFLFLNDLSILRIVLLILAWGIINELFIHYKVNKSFPTSTVIDSGVNPSAVALFHLHVILSTHKNTASLVKRIMKEKDVEFLIEKIGGYTINIAEISIQELLNKAVVEAKETSGVYLTPADIFTAYLLLSESQTHILLEKEITEKDLFEILLWTRAEFQLDVKKDHTLHFTGYGVFDFFIYGWDTNVKEYSIDLTDTVIGKHAIPIVGREKQFNQMVEILSKATTNNVLLVGEPGVGKSSLVKRLALESYRDPRFILTHRKVYELFVDRLIAGIESGGALEERLGLLLSEIAHAGNIILFIQNIENIYGAGGFNFDMSGVLYEYVKSGSIQLIGTTNPSSYKTIIEPKTSLNSLFEKIRIDEPERTEQFQMIAAHIKNIEDAYNVGISYKAIHAAIELSNSYLPDVYQPGKALTLLEDTCSRVRMEGRPIVEKDDVISVMEEKTHIVLAKPGADEKKMLLTLEEELHKRVVGQNEAIVSVAKAIRRLRSGFSQHNRPISVFLFLGPTGVGKTETAKALANLYFGDENAMIRVDMSEFQTPNEAERLLGGVGGEEGNGSLTEMVSLHPYSLILLDEFEKAYPHILDIFLQIFEDGRLTDNSGKTVSFKNTIIIATSNAGSEAIRELIHQKEDTTDLKNVLVEGLLKEGIFKPELLNRFDDVVVFKPLTQVEAKEIAKLLLISSLKTLEDDQIYLTFDDRVLEKIVKESFDEEAGARNMRRYIGSSVEDFVSKLILEDKLPKGTHAVLSVDNNNQFTLQ